MGLARSLHAEPRPLSLSSLYPSYSLTSTLPPPPHLQQNILALNDEFQELAKLFHQQGDAPQSEEMLEMMREMLVLANTTANHSKALVHLKETYIASGTPTSFEETVLTEAQQISIKFPYDPADSREYKNVLAFVQEDGGDRMQHIDDEIAIEGGDGSNAFKNEHCPVTNLPVLELENPVEDEAGFIYERDAVCQILDKERNQRYKFFIGSSHVTIKENLKPARLVIAAQKAAKKNRRHDKGPR